LQVEQLADPSLPVAEIVAKCPQEQLMAVYNIPAFKDADQFLQLIAAARGKLGKVRCQSLVTATPLSEPRTACAARLTLQWIAGRTVLSVDDFRCGHSRAAP
jgi:hypothetical protein